MARQVLPIVGAEVGAYFGGLRPVGLSWWRRALVRSGQALIRWGTPRRYFGCVGGGLIGGPVDPEKLRPSEPDSPELFVPVKQKIHFSFPGQMDMRTQRQLSAELNRQSARGQS